MPLTDKARTSVTVSARDTHVEPTGLASEIVAAVGFDVTRMNKDARTPPGYNLSDAAVWSYNMESLYACVGQLTVYVLGSNGRVALLRYLREQSVSIDYHRYGNLGEREEEPRTRTL